LSRATCTENAMEIRGVHKIRGARPDYTDTPGRKENDADVHAWGQRAKGGDRNQVDFG